jgi:hypothetical protein
MKLKLRPIEDGKDKNRYCGPSVIRQQTGRSRVTGTYTREVRRALEACGIKSIPVHNRFGARRKLPFHSLHPTLAGWLRESKEDRTPGRVFLISAGHHWQLVSGRRYVCGRIREIVSIKDKRVKRRARVREVYELISDNVTKPVIDVSKPRSKSNPAYYQIKKLITQYPEFELSYERDDIDTWVSMSDELEKLATELDHRLSDEHYCCDMEEVWKRIKEMVKFGKEHYPAISSQ